MELTIRLNARQIQAMERILLALSAAYIDGEANDATHLDAMPPDDPYTGEDLDELEALVTHLKVQQNGLPPP